MSMLRSFNKVGHILKLFNVLKNSELQWYVLDHHEVFSLNRFVLLVLEISRDL